MNFTCNLSPKARQYLDELLKNYPNPSTLIEAALIHLAFVTRAKKEIDDEDLTDFLFSTIEIPRTFPVPKNKRFHLHLPDLQPVEQDEESDPSLWISGQCNRLLPLKLAVRAVAALGDPELKGFVNFDQVRDQLAQAALKLGRYLAAFDLKHRLAPEHRYATSFPSADRSEHLSMMRFINQYLIRGGLRAKRAAGMALEYGLIEKRNFKGGLHLCVTRQGLEFARLPNPIIDTENLSEGTPRLSSEERSFLLTHIEKHVSVERSAFRMLALAIKQDIATPDALDVFLGKPEKRRDPILSTQRAGAISRMQELGLVDRKIMRPRVQYFLTSLGQDWVKEQED